MYGIRGAITIKENSKDEIKEASLELFEKIVNENYIKLEDIVSIIISCTKDITKDYPGKFIRENYKLGLVPIMHFNEMEVELSTPFCIRFLITVNGSNSNIKYVYLRGAEKLRTDLFNNN